MKSEQNFALLNHAGDPLERVICAYHEELSPVIYAYADVWADFVYPQRKEDGSIVEEKWMPFAGSHYTALIRLYHALQSKKRIERIAEEISTGPALAELLLDAHLASATFWESLGSCIDNLALAFEDADLITTLVDDEDIEQEGKAGRKQIKIKYPLLGDVYDRRTQFIHSRLVPQKVSDGALTFNVRLLQTKETNWPTQHGVEEEFVQDFHTAFWHDCLAELGDAWKHLQNWLKNVKDGQPTPRIQFEPIPVVIVPPEQIEIPDGSTPPSNIEWNKDWFSGPNVAPSG
ncbi:hypothetical protein AB1L42_22645 [Thalassoglobus sp. JC818]|uniref:hypothetical protein n=1 Tax=Thalassoglobus sp. JC818 TaxID=3232136 RepID=UPI0034575489